MAVKRRKPHTTPAPLFVVSGMPDHISIDRGGDYFVIRCGRCGGSIRHGLPVTSTELQRLADEFGAAHRHEAEHWFSAPQLTVEAAQALYEYELFSAGAVFRTPDGRFVMALLRKHSYTPHDAARNIQRLTGYEMVSYADPIFGTWKPYQMEASDDSE